MLLSSFTFHSSFFILFALLLGWLLDLCFGDPARLPHPIVWFGKAIATCEHRFNHGDHRKLKGALVALALILSVFLLTSFICDFLNPTYLHDSAPLSFWRGVGGEAFNTLTVFYCLAGTTLIREVRAVFLALDRSLDEGRRQVARIVGRDTGELSAQEVRTAALETLAENLSDGVVAPLFWFALLGAPGMLTYKMINTLDSMIGYRTGRYRDFGCWAARIDDVANYVPARLTALLMLLVAPLVTALWHGGMVRKNGEKRGSPLGRRWRRLRFVLRYGPCHASPNSGWPEAALASVLDCRFGGTHDYFGESVEKPYIGDNPRPLATADLYVSLHLCLGAEVVALLVSVLALYVR